MFGSKKTTDDKSNNASKMALPSGENTLNSLVRGTVIEGNIVAENDIRVDGVIRGTLRCNAKVIIGPSGLIDGEVKCESAMIEGKFYGKLRVNDLLSVKESAEVVGDVSTGKLMIASGAVFNVTCDMKSNKDKSDDKIQVAKPELAMSNGATKR
jgi:cytoskeletal protein CcmA (bactofilin family)